MQMYWIFVVADKEGKVLRELDCDFMGRYGETLNMLSKEHFDADWMLFSTFTKSDFDPELHTGLGFDESALPEYRRLFEPEEGLMRLGKLRTHLQLHEKEFVQNEWINEEDFEALMVDFNTAIDRLQWAMQNGHKWYLDVDVD